MMLRALLVLCVLSSSAMAANEGSSSPSTCTITAQAGPILVKACDLYFSKHKDVVFVLWDSLPYRGALAAAGDGALTRTAQGLVEGPGVARYPAAAAFRVAVAEVTDRDAYGLPRWDTIKMLLRNSYTVDKKGRASLVQDQPKGGSGK
jgi:hypothetical protein